MMLLKETIKKLSALFERTSPALVGLFLLCLPVACDRESGNLDASEGNSPTTNDAWSIPVNPPQPAQDSSDPENRRGPEDGPGPENRRGPEDGPGPENRRGPEDRGRPSNAVDGNGSNDFVLTQDTWPQRLGYEAKRRFEETLPIRPKTGFIFGDSPQGIDRTIEVEMVTEEGRVGDFKLLVYGFLEGDLNEEKLPLKGKPPELLWISEDQVKSWPKTIEFRVPSEPSLYLLPAADVDADLRMGPGDFYGPGVNVATLDGSSVVLSIDRLLKEPENVEIQNSSPFPSTPPPSSQGCSG
jgi:hypothetical protein